MATIYRNMLGWLWNVLIKSTGSLTHFVGNLQWYYKNARSNYQDERENLIIYLFISGNRVTVQIVSIRPLTSVAQCESQAKLCGICGDGQSGTVTGFLPSRRASPVRFYLFITGFKKHYWLTALLNWTFRNLICTSCSVKVLSVTQPICCRVAV
jgi:hypothetical protein